MTDNQKIILSFVAGTAAGVALGLYMTSDQGQETINKAKDKLKELEEDFSENLEKQVHELNDNVNELMAHMQQRGEKVFEDTVDKVKENLGSNKSAAKAAVSDGSEKAETGKKS